MTATTPVDSQINIIILHSALLRIMPNINEEIAAPKYELKSNIPTNVDVIFLCENDKGMKDSNILLQPYVIAEITAIITIETSGKTL